MERTRAGRDRVMRPAVPRSGDAAAVPARARVIGLPYQRPHEEDRVAALKAVCRTMARCFSGCHLKGTRR